MLKPCLDCGDLSERSRCPEHDRATPKASSTVRGYDTPWRRLSERARRLQPFCDDCGTSADLTVDHTPEAWRRRAAGLEIRLQDVAVVCRSCNAKRGRARPETWGDGVAEGRRRPTGKAEFRSHTPGGIR
jgi:5-methylcytosine-specific restriction endonuclease McrA